MELDFNILAAWENNLLRIANQVAFDEWDYEIDINLAPDATQEIILNNLPWNCILVSISGNGSHGELDAACALGINFYEVDKNSTDKDTGMRNDIILFGTKNPYLETFNDNYDSVMSIVNVSDRNNLIVTNPTIVGKLYFGRRHFIDRIPFNLLTDS